jgi:hypothetical protein
VAFLAAELSRALIDDKGGSDTGQRAVQCPGWLQNIPWFMTKSALVDCNRVDPQPPRALLSTRPRLPTTAIARTSEPSTRMQTFAIILVIFVGIQGILSTTRVSLS